MDDPLLLSAWQKFCWGFSHSHHLRNELGAWSQKWEGKDTLQVTTEFVPEDSVFEVKVDSVVAVPPYWASIVGDIAFNYRCALDHLAWALVSRGSTPPSQLDDRLQRRVCFPVVRKRKDFASAAGNNLPGVTGSDLAAVKAVQPFDEQGRQLHGHWLTITGDMNNQDKHRHIRPVINYPAGGEFTFLRVQDCEILSTTYEHPGGQALEPGMVLGRIPARATGPAPAVWVRPSIRTEIAVWDNVELGTWLTKTEGHMKRLLEQFSPLPSDRITDWVPAIRPVGIQMDDETPTPSQIAPADA